MSTNNRILTNEEMYQQRKTVGEQIREAKETCTAMDLTTPLDRLKKSDGSLDYLKLEKLIKQLREFGPYYGEVLEIIAMNIKG